MEGRISVLVVDDYPLVRSGVRTAISGEPDINVVGEADNGLNAIRMTRQLRPDVVLMDVSMPPGITGLEASRSMSADPATRHTKIVMLSVHVDDETVFDALRCGVSGFLLKDTPPEKIVEAVRTVAGGGSVLSPDLAARVITEFAKRPTVNRTSEVGLKHLTERERDVFKMLVCGYHNDEIAKMLFVAESTVKSHVQRLYDKLGVRDRVQVVIYAYEHGLIAMGQGASQRPASDLRPGRGDGGDIASAPGAAGLPGAPDRRHGVAGTAPRR